MGETIIAKKARVADILTAAGSLTGVSTDRILGPERIRKVSQVRQAVCFVGRRIGHSYPQIARVVLRNHTSVIEAVRAASARAKRDPDYGEFIERLEQRAISGKFFAPIVVAAPPPEQIPEAETLHRSQSYYNRNVRDGSRRLAAAMLEARAA